MEAGGDVASKVDRILKRSLQAAAQPALIRQWMLKRSRRASFSKKMDYDAMERPHYGYGVQQAARQARALKIPRISVMEFGVAAGAGLRLLEQVAEEVEREEGVQIEVYGFDTGKGMPPPSDPRDLPFAWTTGQFRMPVKQVQASLKRAKLVLGDVRVTVPRFLYRNYLAPIGFVAIDVDYYTSTVNVLRLLDATPEFLLPRVLVYLDDVIGDDLEMHCEFVGELAAVREFNERHTQRKIGQIHALKHKRIIPAWWNDVMYVAHVFDHPRYTTYINTRWAAPAQPAALTPVQGEAPSADASIHPVIEAKPADVPGMGV
jgi:hypothetical protein